MTILLLPADPSLGRVGKETFSQQTLMELFIAGMHNAQRICIDDDSPVEICDWTGVVLDSAGHVTEIDFKCSDLRGSVQLEWLPPTVVLVFLDFNTLSGSIDLTRLPPAPRELVLSWNRFTGCVDLTSLPETLETLDLTWNKLSGPIDVRKLPSGMKTLYLNRNEFTGHTDFRFLPEQLEVLNVSSTNLSGEVIFRQGRKVYVSNSNVRVYSNR